MKLWIAWEKQFGESRVSSTVATAPSKEKLLEKMSVFTDPL